jgi:hypothetical protein
MAQVHGKQLKDASVDTGQMAAGFIEASSTGRAFFDTDVFDSTTIGTAFADDSFTEANMAKFNTGCMTNAVVDDMFAANSIDATTVGNIIAADSFTEANMSKFNTGCMTNAVVDDMFAANAIDQATVANIFAADSFDATNMSKFATGAFTNAVVDDVFASGAFDSANVGTIFAADSFTAANMGVFATDAFTEAVVDDVFASAAIDTDRLKEGSTFIKSDGTVAMAANLNMGTSYRIINLADGTGSSDAVTKGQLDAVTAGLDPKESCEAATTQPLLNDSTTPAYSATGGTGLRGQITFATGPTAIDGHSLSNDDRIIVKDEEDGTQQVSSVDTVADSSGSLNNDYFVIYATPNLAYYVWYNVASGGTDPTPSAPAGVTYTGVEVALATNDTADTVASNTKTQLDALTIGGSTEAGVAPFTTGVVSNAMTMTNYYGGLCTDVAEGVGTGFTFGTDTPGTGLGPAANGIWVRTSQNTWDRATDFDTDAEVTNGAYSFVINGTANHDTGFILTSHDPVTIGGAAGSPILWATFTQLTLGGTPSTIQCDDAASEGSSGSAARSDHVHAIACAAPSSVGTSNTEGSASSFARSDHVHDSPGVTTSDKSQNPTTTANSNGQTTGLTITSTPALDSYVRVLINGIGAELGDGVKTLDCYFSDDGGTTAKAISAITAADTLYWNSLLAGYVLTNGTDIVDFDYLV